MMASKVSALSHRPRIMVSRPASMRLAMAISPSRTEQLHRAHLAQIHAHRVVGAVVGAFLGGLDDRRSLRAPPTSPPSARGASSSASTTLTPISRQHGQRVLDRLGGDFLGRQHLVQLVHGDVAAGLGLLDELLDARRRSGRAADRRSSAASGASAVVFAHLGLRDIGGGHARPAPKMVSCNRQWQGPGVITTRPRPKPFPSSVARRSASRSALHALDRCPCQRRPPRSLLAAVDGVLQRRHPSSWPRRRATTGTWRRRG